MLIIMPIERINLLACKPFPYRDLRVDPVDPEHVESLRASIREFGFWGGPVVRRSSKYGFEIISGLARIEAAIVEGITEANLFVGELSDAEAIRIYEKKWVRR